MTLSDTKATHIPLSEFARFHQYLKGYWLYKDGEKLEKWEVFDMGYNNPVDIINGFTSIRAKIAPPISDRFARSSSSLLQYYQKLMNVRLFYKDKQIRPTDAFLMGHTNADMIIQGKTPIRLKL